MTNHLADPSFRLATLSIVLNQGHVVPLRAAVGTLALLAACTRDVEIFDADATQLVIAAVLDPQGAVTAGRVLDEDDSFSPTVPEAGRIVAWTIEKSDLVGLDGLPLGPEMVGQISLLPTEGCGRCLLPTDIPPQVLRPGDACAVPSFATQLRGVEADRAQVRLSLPGSCPCPIPNTNHHTASPLEVAPIYPSADAWPLARVEMDPSGELGIFGEHIAARVASRTELVSTAHPHVFPGPILSAASVGNSTFVAAVHDANVPESTNRLHVIQPDLSVVPAAALRVESADMVHLSGGRVLNVGWRGGPALELCSAPYDDEHCRLLLDEGFDPGVEKQFEVASSDDSGRVFASGTRGSLMVIEEIPEDFTAVTSETSSTGASFGTFVSPSKTTHWRFDPKPFARLFPATSIVAAYPMEGGWLACLQEPHLGTVIVSVRSDPASYQHGFSATQLAVRDAGCWGFYRDGGRGIFHILASQTALSCSLDECREQPLAFDFYLRPRAGPGGYSVASSEGGVLRRDPSSGQFESVFGTPERTAPFGRVVSLGDLVWAFDGLSHVREVRPDGTTEQHALPDLTFNVLDAAFDATRNEVWVAGTSSIARIDTNDLEMTHLTMPRELSSEFSKYIHIAVVAPGTLLVAGESPDLYILREDRFEKVAIDWDDPETAETETIEPQATCASPYFRSVSAANGGAVATGCNAVVIRVFAYGSPPLGQRISLRRNDFIGQSQPTLNATTMVCPDVVGMGMVGRNRQDREHGRLAWLTPSESGPSVIGGGPVDLVEDASNPNALTSRALDSDQPVRLVAEGWSDRPSFVLVFWSGSLHRVGASQRLRLEPMFIYDATRFSSGEILISGASNHLFLGR